MRGQHSDKKQKKKRSPSVGQGDQISMKEAMAILNRNKRKVFVKFKNTHQCMIRTKFMFQH